MIYHNHQRKDRMNEQDEKILQLYLKDVRKKKIFILFAIIFLIVGIVFYGFYAENEQSSNEIENSIQEEIQKNSMNENITNEEITFNIVNTILEENKANEILKENTNTVTEEENTKQQTKDKPKENTQTISTEKENKGKSTKEKPSNKDFLFKDGYTMENVTQAAENYLKSSGYAGKCIPIKDKDGVYTGMRVIFD